MNSELGGVGGFSLFYSYAFINNLHSYGFVNDLHVLKSYGSFMKWKRVSLLVNQNDILFLFPN